MIKARVKKQVKKAKIKYTCGNCGGEDIEIKVWWDPNKDIYVEEVDDDYGYCKFCDDATPVATEIVR